ncbi:hypothetical protein GMW39_01345 [Pectobacterium parmentieri]|uniref:hypothetical protein n=1 Tax=Pectobacterium parmentieri TaxID=1905730 RepID=UPI000D6097CC|nr:hypothetical protein [Pectobacterium parmentieri]PWD58525.1 hypothetical protein DF211_19480 [Pectobacterium parmentieri]QHQ14640.1 hypothetical protein GMW39_01345 [Pectobacterium parmentieri]
MDGYFLFRTRHHNSSKVEKTQTVDTIWPTSYGAPSEFKTPEGMKADENKTIRQKDNPIM